jgi:ParB-like chromosome segregation protein Spo0J
MHTAKNRMNQITTTTTEAQSSATKNNHADIRRVTEVALDDLEPHPLSAAIYGKEAATHLVTSVREEGVLTPLLVNSANGRIVSGNTRYEACKLAGLGTVPVIYVSLTEEDEKLRLVTSNVARTKSNTQRTLEFNALFEVYKAKARAGEKDESDTTAGLEKSQDKAAAIVGIGASSLKKGAAVLTAADTLEAKGDKDGAEKLRKLLDGPRGFDPSFKEAVKMGVVEAPKKRLKKNKAETGSGSATADASIVAVTGDTPPGTNVGSEISAPDNATSAEDPSASWVAKLETLTAAVISHLSTASNWNAETGAAARKVIADVQEAIAAVELRLNYTH